MTKKTEAKPIPVGTVLDVAIGRRHMVTHIGDTEWLLGKVVETLDDDVLRVEVAIDATMHGRVVDNAGNFLISDAEKRAGKIVREVPPVRAGVRNPINVWAMSEKQEKALALAPVA
jgi:hypothetical protein